MNPVISRNIAEPPYTSLVRLSYKSPKEEGDFVSLDRDALFNQIKKSQEVTGKGKLIAAFWPEYKPGEYLSNISQSNISQWEKIKIWSTRGIKDEIQTIPYQRWNDHIKEVDRVIRFAYDQLSTKDAIKEISEIWEQLEKTSELAAARSRLLIGKLPKPKLVPLSKWFEDQKPKLFESNEDEVAANPCAVSSAELLVRAAIAAVPQAKDLEAEIETGPMGRVIIDWYVPEGRLQWMVEALDVPWPSVKVYQLIYQDGLNAPNAMETRIIYNAFDVIDSFRQFFGKP